MNTFEVLADQNRRRILEYLREEERPVGDVVRALGISQPGVSKHLRVLRRAGLVGLEAVYGSYRTHEREGYTDLARRFDLVPSGGSDYHGTYKPELQLGAGYGDLAVPAGLMEEMRAKARET